MKTAFRFAAVLMTLGWMALIFGFSAQSGEASGGLSALIAKPITEMIAAWTGLNDSADLYARVDAAVRNSAHFCEYAVLGCLFQLIFYSFSRQTCLLPWGAGTLYAILDEWHQAYSPGRVCDPMDVLIDTCGVLGGVLLMRWLIKIWRNKHVYHQ